jgi:PAS domain S-box-containing protein
MEARKIRLKSYAVTRHHATKMSSRSGGSAMDAAAAAADAQREAVDSSRDGDDDEEEDEDDDDDEAGSGGESGKRGRGGGGGGGGRNRKRPKKGGVMTEDELRERRKKHNEVEIRRRQRIKSSFDELGEMCGCDSKQKRVVLSTAIQLLQEYQSKIERLQQNIAGLEEAAIKTEEESKAALGAAAAAAVGAGSGVALPDSTQGGVDHLSLFRSAGVPLLIASFDGRILDSNEAFAKLIGFTRSELLQGQATTFFSLTAPETLSVAFSTVGSLMSGTPSVQAQLTIIGAGGRPTPCTLTAWFIREQTKPQYFMAMLIPSHAASQPQPPPQPPQPQPQQQQIMELARRKP